MRSGIDSVAVGTRNACDGRSFLMVAAHHTSRGTRLSRPPPKERPLAEAVSGRELPCSWRCGPVRVEPECLTVR